MWVSTWWAVSILCACAWHGICRCTSRELSLGVFLVSTRSAGAVAGLSTGNLGRERGHGWKVRVCVCVCVDTHGVWLGLGDYSGCGLRGDDYSYKLRYGNRKLETSIWCIESNSLEPLRVTHGYYCQGCAAANQCSLKMGGAYLFGRLGTEGLGGRTCVGWSEAGVSTRILDPGAGGCVGGWWVGLGPQIGSLWGAW